MRLFKNRAEAEAAGFSVERTHYPWLALGQPSPSVGHRSQAGVVRTDLEAQLVEALEAVEWSSPRRDPGSNKGGMACPVCGRFKADGHNRICRISLALKSARGEA